MERITYGSTPWGKWFVDVLNSYHDDARLDRGKSYANTGKVLSIKIDGGKVTSSVRGHYDPKYSVQIDFPPLSDADSKTVLNSIEENPALLARIRAGELPEELLQALIKKNIHLIPKHWNDIKRKCSCPDIEGDPCKHIAAVFYILAKTIDSEPHTLFKLRGIDLQKHFASGAAYEIEPPFQSVPAPKKTPNAISPNTIRNIENIEFPEIPQLASLILSLLPKKSTFCKTDFSVELASLYHAGVKAIRIADLAYTDDAASEHERAFSHSNWNILWGNIDDGAEDTAGVPTVMRETAGGKKDEYTLLAAFSLFCSFSPATLDEGTDGYRFLFYFFRLCHLLLHAQAFVPCPVAEKQKLHIIWKAFDTIPAVNQALDALTFFKSKTVLNWLIAAFFGEWVKKVSRDFTRTPTNQQVRLLRSLFFDGAVINVASPVMRHLPIAIDRWLSALRIDFSAWHYRFTLKDAASLKKKSENSEEKEDDDYDDVENEDAEAHFSLSLEVLLPEPVALNAAVKKCGNPEVLRAPIALSNYLEEIKELTEKKSVVLPRERLNIFLTEASELLERLGIEVVLPKELKKQLKPRLVLNTAEKAKKSASLVSYLSLDSLLDWEWQIAIGDEVVSRKELAALLKQKSAVVRFRGRFVRLNINEAAFLLAQSKAITHNVSAPDFLRAHFAGDTLFSGNSQKVIDSLLEKKDFVLPQGLNASLRPYQIRGFEWVCNLLHAGLGCILADDMGLGKTVQAIAVLLHFYDESLLENQCLVVAPAALLENWRREIERFAPSLRVYVYHGKGRSIAHNADVFLTTYQTAVRDVAALTERKFSFLIADEAHLMKNAQTRGAQTAKMIRANYKLALSGTPVENRLEDLRSLFDFVLPDYLGSAETFKKKFRVPIEVERDAQAAKKLKSITSPFLLRRLKTDKTVIADLPDKIVQNHWTELEKEQGALYKSIVEENLKRSERITDKNERSNLIFSLLTSLKQVCDHPRVYDKESPELAALSGKAKLLCTLLDEILSGQEKVLIFSQYVETLHVLQHIIAAELDETCLLYYGGMSSVKRNEAVERFQTDAGTRIFLVSLRAGGLGLNLTAASRVIHYDLWYNPAVENQATDRAFRIGQKRTVFVHRFITRNSFEEKIEAMLSDKKKLADMTVSSGESWLSRMSHHELKELFAL